MDSSIPLGSQPDARPKGSCDIIIILDYTSSITWVVETA